MSARSFKRILSYLYRKMQESYVTFRILVWLEESGLVERMMVMFSGIGKNKADLDENCRISQAFYEKHRNEVNKLMDILEDKKSRDVYKACIAKRCYGTKIDKSLFCEKNQYFDEEIVTLRNGEVFIDCGAFIGDTIQQFQNRMKRKHLQNYNVVAFEPSCRNASLINKFFKSDERITLIKKGVSDRNERIMFADQGPKSRTVTDPTKASDVIETICLDDISECRGATFIKMDIEGAETRALAGAQRIIKSNLPKLAICIYHSNEDMLQIPLKIHELYPEYRLYIRHHSMGNVETVLYAVKKG